MKDIYKYGILLLPHNLGVWVKYGIEKFTISNAMWSGHQRRLKEHREKGNGFGYSLFDEQSDYVSTISARYWKDGSEVLIAQKGKNPRILTPRECARIQGFPDQLIHIHLLCILKRFQVFYNIYSQYLNSEANLQKQPELISL